jgi:hypothetical protein
MERFDAEMVAGAEQPAVAAVPDHIGKIAEDAARGVFTPALIGAEDDFGVGARPESRTERSPEFVAIVHPSVHSEAKIAGLIMERLPLAERLRGGAKHAMTETYGAIHDVTDAVGTAIGDAGGHALEEREVGGTTIQVEDAGYGAHARGV